MSLLFPLLLGCIFCMPWIEAGLCGKRDRAVEAVHASEKDGRPGSGPSESAGEESDRSAKPEGQEGSDDPAAPGSSAGDPEDDHRDGSLIGEIERGAARPTTSTAAGGKPPLSVLVAGIMSRLDGPSHLYRTAVASAGGSAGRGPLQPSHPPRAPPAV